MILHHSHIFSLFIIHLIFSLLFSLSCLGIPIKYHGMEVADSIHYAGLVSELQLSTQEFLNKKLFRSDDSTELVTIRLRSKKHEIIVAPG
jgi:hypothetical protein